MTWTIYPAIDVRDGRVVRLAQGDYGRQTQYEDSPLALAKRYQAAGASWLHLVDLDAALSGGYSLVPLVERIKAETGLQVQTGGGLRSEPDIESVLRAGADRVVLGTVAVREPDRVARWLQRFGAEKIAIALDTRQDASGRWRLPVKGWTEDSPKTLGDLLQAYGDRELRHVLCTDIARDGMLGGFNFGLYERLHARWPGLSLQASGGGAVLDELRALREFGVAGAVLGRALLEERFTLQEALAC
jgi:phosphoribosylformimino-5-aminoimidazole carboxamide ribotide isomerase